MIVFLIVTLLAPRVDAAAVIPGTYKVRVCSTPCTDNPQQLPDVHGWLVIFPNDLDMSRLPTREREYLEGHTGFILYPDIKANACFILETSNEKTPLLAGLSRIGFTRWKQSASVLTVTLYRSPDASDTAAGVVQGSAILAGEPEEPRIRASSTYRRSYLSGERIGDPDFSVCARAARELMKREKKTK